MSEKMRTVSYKSCAGGPRTSINSVMLSGLQYDGDGGLTFDIQHRSPGKNEPNWLPSSDGLFWIMLSLCWSGPLDGR